MVLYESSMNVAERMSYNLPASLGTGTRKNFNKRHYDFNDLAEIKYKTMACPDKDAALSVEGQLRSTQRHRFPT